MLGLKGKLPEIFTELEVNYFLLRRLLGVKTADGKQAKVAKLAKNEVLMVNIGSTATGAKVVAVKADAAKLQLTSPACTKVGEKVALSRRIEKHWRLIGWYVYDFVMECENELTCGIGPRFCRARRSSRRRTILRLDSFCLWCGDEDVSEGQLREVKLTDASHADDARDMPCEHARR